MITTRRACAVLLALVVLGVPAVCGCGDGDKTTADIIIGIEADFTGPSSQTIIEIYEGITDFVREMEKNDPIPGARIKFITFDDRLDYSRGPVGYEWLKGRGAAMQMYSNPFILATVADRCQQDEMPAYSYSSTQDLLDRDWIYTTSGTYEWEAESVMKWIVEDYWPAQQAGRPPKVGYLGLSGYVSSTVYLGVMHRLHAAQPGSFEMVEETPPMGATTFAAEIHQLRDSDVIIINTVGSAVPSFMKEARARGYQGLLVGTSISTFGSWKSVRDVLSPEQLDGTVSIHNSGWWTDEGSIWAELEPALRRLRPDEYDSLRMGGTWVSGWLSMKVLAEAARRAAAEVGPENVDGRAIRDAMLQIDVTVPGYGEAWKFRQGTTGDNVLHRMFVMRQYLKAEDDWFALGDWFLPPSLAS